MNEYVKITFLLFFIPLAIVLNTLDFATMAGIISIDKLTYYGILCISLYCVASFIVPTIYLSCFKKRAPQNDIDRENEIQTIGRF